MPHSNNNNNNNNNNNVRLLQLHSVHSQSFNSHMLTCVLSSPPNKFYTLDSFPTFMLREFATYYCHDVTYVVNRSFESIVRLTAVRHRHATSKAARS